MNIIKVYNNNVVWAKNDQDEELIVMGKGLGFQKKRAMLLPLFWLKRLLFCEMKGLVMN